MEWLISHVFRIEFRNMSVESVILLEEFSSSQADNKSVVRAAVSPSPFDIP